MYKAQSQKVQAQQLKVQEVVVRQADANLYSAASGNVTVNIGEPLSAAVQVLFQDDSAGTLAPVAAANLSIVDSSAGTAGGDSKAIKITGVTMATSDLLVIRYITAN